MELNVKTVTNIERRVSNYKRRSTETRTIRGTDFTGKRTKEETDQTRDDSHLYISTKLYPYCISKSICSLLTSTTLYAPTHQQPRPYYRQSNFVHGPSDFKVPSECS